MTELLSSTEWIADDGRVGEGGCVWPAELRIGLLALLHPISLWRTRGTLSPYAASRFQVSCSLANQIGLKIISEVKDKRERRARVVEIMPVLEAGMMYQRQKPDPLNFL